MIQWLLVAFAAVSALASESNYPKSAYNIEVAKQRCQAHFSQSKTLYMQEFSWGYTMLEMQDRFEDIYSSGKRLSNHSFYEESTDTFLLYFDLDEPRRVPITTEFIKNVTRHLEIAIANGYAEYVFFPDMGHSHLYFPEVHWQKEYEPFDTGTPNRHNLYKKMFADPEMKALYHLAEQLAMVDEHKHLLDDEYLQFRYWHRNFVGHNNGLDSFEIHVATNDKKFNTVKEINGYEDFSAGFAVSSSEKGCFPYYDKNGNVRYFDISLYDPQYDISQYDDDDFQY